MIMVVKTETAMRQDSGLNLLAFACQEIGSARQALCKSSCEHLLCSQRPGFSSAAAVVGRLLRDLFHSSVSQDSQWQVYVGS